ncbi:hypothetical protein EGW08_005847 [Elysia chlorotica]|uniref:Uncharacterized protein n=1 Tax=Elysia chlorotica TaxID=188477 RepID=A0A3S1BEC9_ELYCH|nr:hypothetical protein EGW08_005847 [Elysia chlorotica]
MGSLGILLEKELSALEKVHPGPSFEQIQVWFSAYEVQVRMLAEWVELLAKYVHEDASDQTLPVEKAGASSRDGGVGTNWCMEVAKYLDAHNKTLPPSSGMVCADIEYLTCNFFSELYFLAVRLFADSSYLRPAEFYCHESWVPKCLPQDSPSTVLRFKPQG